MYSCIRLFMDQGFDIGKESVDEQVIDLRDIYQRFDHVESEFFLVSL